MSFFIRRHLKISFPLIKNATILLCTTLMSFSCFSTPRFARTLLRKYPTDFKMFSQTGKNVFLSTTFQNVIISGFSTGIYVLYKISLWCTFHSMGSFVYGRISHMIDTFYFVLYFWISKRMRLSNYNACSFLDPI